MYDFTLNGTFCAPVTALYKAFHAPELLIQWFAPGAIQLAQVMANFEEKGRYRMVMQEPSGAQYVLVGEYVSILPNESLVYTWAWEDNLEQSVVSTVEVSFTAIDDSTTELNLHHSGFANQAECDQHQQAWISCLEKLSALNWEEASAI